jgi:hypothetical protein
MQEPAFAHEGTRASEKGQRLDSLCMAAAAVNQTLGAAPPASPNILCVCLSYRPQSGWRVMGLQMDGDKVSVPRLAIEPALWNSVQARLRSVDRNTAWKVRRVPWKWTKQASRSECRPVRLGRQTPCRANSRDLQGLSFRPDICASTAHHRMPTWHHGPSMFLQVADSSLKHSSSVLSFPSSDGTPRHSTVPASEELS